MDLTVIAGSSGTTFLTGESFGLELLPDYFEEVVEFEVCVEAQAS